METLIAISILAIVVAITSTVIINSIRNMRNAKNRIVAVNIAREGIEAMRNVRDSNWLLYSDRRRDCWNHDQSPFCDGSTPITPGHYIVYLDSTGRWRLNSADENPDVDSNGDGITDNDLDLTALYFVDIDPTVDSDGDGDFENDLDTYNHTEGLDDHLGQVTQAAGFERYLNIEYLDNNGGFGAISQIDKPSDTINTTNEWEDDGLEQSQLNRMRVSAVVQWVNNGNAHQTELKTILTDHLGRVDLGS